MSRRSNVAILFINDDCRHDRVLFDLRITYPYISGGIVLGVSYLLSLTRLHKEQ